MNCEICIDEWGEVFVKGSIPTVIKMPVSTPRKLVELSARRIEAERALEAAQQKLLPAEAELSACVADCEKLKKDVVASLQLMHGEEERVRVGNSAVSLATNRRNELAKEWKHYQRAIKDGSIWQSEIPQDPASVEIPKSPEPIQTAFIEDHKKLEAEYLANVCKMSAADTAYQQAVSSVNKAEANLRVAISAYIEQEKLYRQRKQAEENSAKEVEEYEARLKEVQIKAAKDKIEMEKKRLAELGVAEQ